MPPIMKRKRILGSETDNKWAIWWFGMRYIVKPQRYDIVPELFELSCNQLADLQYAKRSIGVI